MRRNPLCAFCAFLWPFLWLDFFEANGAAEGGDGYRRVTRPADSRNPAQNVRNYNVRLVNNDWSHDGTALWEWLLFFLYRLLFRERGWRWRRLGNVFQRKIGNDIVLLGHLRIQLKRSIARQRQHDVSGHVRKTVI